MKRLLQTLSLLGVLAAGPALAEELLLENLLGDTGHAAGVLQAESELKAAGSELDRDRAEKGWRVTGAAGYGHIQDVVDEGRSISYQAAQAQLGLSYPLFGSAEKQARAIGLSSGKTQEKKVRLEAARRLAQLELEAQYARYWGAQESLKLVDAYLESEAQLLPRLQQRQDKRMMLGSQMIDSGAGFARARSDRAQLVATRNAARARLERLTGRKLGELQARATELPEDVTMPAGDALQRHPDLVSLQAQRETLQRQQKDSRWYGLDGAFNVNANTVHDTTNSETGGNAFVGVNLSAPLAVGSARRAERNRLNAELETLQLRYRQRQEELLADIGGARDKLAQQREETAAAAQRSRGAHEALRERLRRSGVFAEDGIETLAGKLQSYYAAALAEIDTRTRGWIANVEARAFALAVAEDAAPPRRALLPDSGIGERLAEPIVLVTRQLAGSGPAPRPAAADKLGSAAPAPAPTPVPLRADLPPSATADSNIEASRWLKPVQPRPAARFQMASTMEGGAAIPTAAAMPVAYNTAGSSAAATPAPPPKAGSARGRDDMAVYVWNSQDLIGKQQNRDRFWKLLQRLSIDRLLVSLDAAQIREFRARPAPLSGFLQNARKRGVKVELLLGDAGWIEPKGREQLVELISGLWDFPFDGLHLDIEPDQVYRQPLGREQFDNWVKSMQAAAKASPWPTAISVHPRYFRDEPYSGWKLGERLAEGGVKDVTLMIFNSKPENVASVATPILAGSPQLRFRVAQSVEPQLDAAESHAKRTRADFEKSMSRLQQLLQAQANADGIVVQAWADLMRMGYESEIR
ncbi:TolC family protein [Solimonas sp. K1W22B-7]|uniref:TolC family protein n=1 Tax=Solimonas sp. K1W22B-7 TaxID=2303331 RepID=UPI0013C44295|nr:TolC family protein [Solimonas sp. K1W22B-7]